VYGHTHLFDHGLTEGLFLHFDSLYSHLKATAHYTRDQPTRITHTRRTNVSARVLLRMKQKEYKQRINKLGNTETEVGKE
jgi:hypothetical protein